MRILTIVAALVMAQMAAAKDVALILGDIGQVETMRADTPVTTTDFAAPLRAAGFEILSPKNRSSGNLRLTAKRLETAIERSEVDRLVIVALGPIVSSDREAWVLSNGGTGASALNVGVAGIPVGALSDMAQAAQGRSVILIAPGHRMSGLGIGLRPGLGELRVADGVTYVIGTPEALVAVLNDHLLDPAVSFADAARDADDVEMMGFLSDRVGLMSPP